MILKSNSAILIFANSPSVDSCRKGFAKGENLFEHFNQNILKKVEKTKLPYFIITEKEQRGQNFGERYHNALKDIFDKGFDNVISIGNDTPQLNIAHVLDAQASLLKSKSVIGPSIDGGFYLLGIDRNIFEQLNFKGFAWQTPQLFNQFIDALKQFGQNINCLNPLADIDEVRDIKYFQNFYKTISKTIQALISTTLQQFKPVFSDINLISSGIHAHIPFNKGSPIVI